MASTSQRLQQLLGGNAALNPSAIRPLSGSSNPFRHEGSNPQGQYADDDDAIGVNRPYQSARFLGYHNNKAVYAGSRLNVCC